MFDYLFPIFCFGLAVTGIVVKGLIAAADMANSQLASGNEKDAESAGHPARDRPASTPERA